MYEPISPSFFHQSVFDVARQLLGQYIVHEINNERIIVRIVETEVYHGPEDRAAHSYQNRRTKRTEVMFGEPGLVYTYQMHRHILMNVVCGPVGVPHAVLIRAAEPIEGEHLIQQMRGVQKRRIDWTNGPGKLTAALGVTMDYYGHHWSERPLYIAEGDMIEEVAVSPRVGIANSKEAATYPWRYFERDQPFVSKFRP